MLGIVAKLFGGLATKVFGGSGITAGIFLAVALAVSGSDRDWETTL